MRRLLAPAVAGLSMIAVAACADEPAAEAVSIMPIGDSLTNRVGASTYRCYLDQMLHRAGVEFDFVGELNSPADTYTCPTEFDRDHEGISGATISQRAGPALDSVERLQPDVALVLLGANDIGGQQAPNEVAEELASFVQDLQNAQPDVAILVAQLPPCRSSSEWCQENWPAYNDEIATFARLSTDRSPVIVVDMFTDSPLEYIVDSVHPNDAGGEEMARRWMTALVDSGSVSAVDGS